MTESNDPANAFLTGGGETGRLIRDFDWARTSLGPIATWPVSLRTTLSILLNAKLPMGLWWGADLIQFYNDAYRPCLGNEGKHPLALGQRGADCWPQQWPLLEPLINQVLAGGEATWSEDQLIPLYRNGRMEDAYWTFSYSPVRDESGQIAGVMVLCQETTRQVENLRLSRQRFGHFVRQATVGIVVLSGEEMVVEVVNEAYGQLINRRYEELIDRPLFAVIPEAKPSFHSILQGVLRTGEPVYLHEYPYAVGVEGAKKEGFLDVVYQPYREADGSISGVMVLCHEVTGKVLAQQELKESEQRFRTLADHIPNLAWMARPDGDIFWYNRRWYDYTGTTPQQMEGWGWQAVHEPTMLAEVTQNWVRSLTTGKPFEMVFPLRGADGSFRPFLTRVIPVFDENGQLHRWFGTNTDIYEQHLTQQQLQTLNEALGRHHGRTKSGQ